MADIQSAVVEIRRGKKEERRTNYSMKIYMVCPIPQGDHKIDILNYDVCEKICSVIFASKLN